jgi:two-component system CheB/CheR fusion protein
MRPPLGVTEFFRDEEVYSFLKENTLPGLFSRLDSDESLRVCVPGCATGEEVYSVAIMLREYLEEHNQRRNP